MIWYWHYYLSSGQSHWPAVFGLLPIRLHSDNIKSLIYLHTLWDLLKYESDVSNRYDSLILEIEPWANYLRITYRQNASYTDSEVESNLCTGQPAFSEYNVMVKHSKYIPSQALIVNDSNNNSLNICLPQRYFSILILFAHFIVIFQKMSTVYFIQIHNTVSPGNFYTLLVGTGQISKVRCCFLLILHCCHTFIPITKFDLHNTTL